MAPSSLSTVDTAGSLGFVKPDLHFLSPAETLCLNRGQLTPILRRALRPSVLLCWDLK